MFCFVSQLAEFTAPTFFGVHHANSGLKKKTKKKPLNGCQDSDSLEMHGMLVIYYEPPTPTELHFKYKESLLARRRQQMWVMEGKKSKTGRDGAVSG